MLNRSKYANAQMDSFFSKPRSFSNDSEDSDNLLTLLLISIRLGKLDLLKQLFAMHPELKNLDMDSFKGKLPPLHWCAFYGKHPEIISFLLQNTKLTLHDEWSYSIPDPKQRVNRISAAIPLHGDLSDAVKTIQKKSTVIDCAVNHVELNDSEMPLNNINIIKYILMHVSPYELKSGYIFKIISEHKQYLSVFNQVEYTEIEKQRIQALLLSNVTTPGVESAMSDNSPQLKDVEDLFALQSEIRTNDKHALLEKEVDNKLRVMAQRTNEYHQEYMSLHTKNYKIRHDLGVKLRRENLDEYKENLLISIHKAMAENASATVNRVDGLEFAKVEKLLKLKFKILNKLSERWVNEFASVDLYFYEIKKELEKQNNFVFRINIMNWSIEQKIKYEREFFPSYEYSAALRTVYFHHETKIGEIEDEIDRLFEVIRAIVARPASAFDFATESEKQNIELKLSHLPKTPVKPKRAAEYRQRGAIARIKQWQASVNISANEYNSLIQKQQAIAQQRSAELVKRCELSELREAELTIQYELSTQLTRERDKRSHRFVLAAVAGEAEILIAKEMKLSKRRMAEIENQIASSHRAERKLISQYEQAGIEVREASADCAAGIRIERSDVADYFDKYGKANVSLEREVKAYAGPSLLIKKPSDIMSIEAASVTSLRGLFHVDQQGSTRSARLLDQSSVLKQPIVNPTISAATPTSSSAVLVQQARDRAALPARQSVAQPQPVLVENFVERPARLPQRLWIGKEKPSPQPKKTNHRLISAVNLFQPDPAKSSACDRKHRQPKHR